MYPNFERLKAIENEFLRTAIYTATGEERERLEKAFPEYYVSILNDIRIPASILRKNARQRQLDAGNGDDGCTKLWTEIGWSEDLACLDVPLKKWGVETSRLPDEIWSQLAGQEVRGGIEVEYMGQKFLLVFFCDENGPGLDLGDHFPEKREPEWNDWYTFVHSRFIDLTS